MSTPYAASAAPVETASTSAAAAFTSFVLPRCADDLHLHVRDGAALRDSLRPMLEKQTVARAIIMPNLQPPVTTPKMAQEYRERILTAAAEIRNEAAAAAAAPRLENAAAAAAPSLPTLTGADGREVRQLQAGAQAVVAADTAAATAATRDPFEFTPLMTLYLTDQTTPEQIREAKATGFIYACKLYPKGATTHSNQGVTNLQALEPTLQAMADEGLLLLIHGESTDPQVDIFDRESAFFPSLLWLLGALKSLRVVLEHITTAAAVEFVRTHSDGRNLAATITAHHLLYNRNAIFEGGLNPSLYCLPILKRESDRQALLAAVLHQKHAALFFAGTDSAPHPRSSKVKCCGCAAGCFTAFATVELYTEAIADAAHKAGLSHADTQARLADFLCHRGAAFYGLDVNPAHPITLERPFAGETITPLRAGKEVAWRVVS